MAVRDDIIAAIEALKAGEGGGIPGAGQSPQAAGRSPGGVLAGPTGQLSSPSTPANFSSNIGPWAGNIAGAAGAAAGLPGVGMAAGALGQMADLGRYSGVLGQHNISMSPNYGQAALYGASAMPFGIGSLFGTSAREQSESARRDHLGAWGPTPGNVTAMPGPVAPAEERSFFTDLFGGGGNDASGSGQSDSHSQGGGMSSEAATGNFGGNAASTDSSGSWFAKGGIVPPPRPGARNPPGPDDQTAHVRTGEMILTPEQAQRLAGMVAGGDKQRLIAALKAA